MKKLYIILVIIFAITKISYSQTNGYFNVLKITPLTSAPAYFCIDTNIPATDQYAPQIQITGYTYAASNKAVKLTIGWYYYAGNFYWTQYQSDLGYQKPSRIRLGKYTKSGSDYIRIEISNNSTYWANYNIMATDLTDSYASVYSGWTYTEGEMPGTTSQVTVVNQQSNVIIDGYVGIGTTTPHEALSVNGNIRSKEVKVELNNWPDYVFKPTYILPTLTEVKTYIDKNHHLPEMPSEAEVKENGINLGEMVKLQTKKIEELTLYLIEKDRLDKEKDEKLKSLQQQLDQLAKKLNN
jgi:hypothetical protein